jgi:hypothetical protein
MCPVCQKAQEPYLDPRSNKVYCSLCDAEIKNISHFAKIQMQTTKQIRIPTKGISVKCNKCKNDSRPQIVEAKVVCGTCAGPLDNLTPIFKEMLKELLKKEEND